MLWLLNCSQFSKVLVQALFFNLALIFIAFLCFGRYHFFKFLLIICSFFAEVLIKASFFELELGLIFLLLLDCLHFSLVRLHAIFINLSLDFVCIIRLRVNFLFFTRALRVKRALSCLIKLLRLDSYNARLILLRLDQQRLFTRKKRSDVVLHTDWDSHLTPLILCHSCKVLQCKDLFCPQFFSYFSEFTSSLVYFARDSEQKLSWVHLRVVTVCLGLICSFLIELQLVLLVFDTIAFFAMFKINYKVWIAFFIALKFWPVFTMTRSIFRGIIEGTWTWALTWAWLTVFDLIFFTRFSLSSLWHSKCCNLD